MPRKLTQQEFEQKVYDLVGDAYTVVSTYQGKTKPVQIRCNLHNLIFTCGAECFMRGKNDIRSSCPECSKITAEKKLNKFVCDYCGKKFLRAPSKSDTKSGLHFCCRECKDKAQRIENNNVQMWPSHYGEGKNYRERAFRMYPNECSVCGWKEDIDVLEVHHIDENRQNNDDSNLIILCPICHRKLTSHKYKLIERNRIELKC